MPDKTTSSSEKKLYRSGINRMIGGVCAGVAEYFNVDVTVVRIVWVLSVFIHGLGAIAYLACLIFMPENPEHLEIPKEERTPPQNTGLIIGIVLVVLGLIFFIKVNDYWLYDWYFFRYWPFPFRTLWPILLILFGVGYIVYIVHKEKQPKEEGEAVTRPESRKLYRSLSNKMVSGICSGLAKYWQIDVAIVRVAWIVVTILTGFWLGILAYIIMIFAVPEEEITSPSKPVTENKSKTTKRTKPKKKPEKNESIDK
jgi:phage shock protein C